MITMQQFIDDNRGELDRAIRAYLNDANYDIDDDGERELCILNLEKLYNWARAAGVDLEEGEDDK